jgi:hypothetical protein
MEYELKPAAMEVFEHMFVPLVRHSPTCVHMGLFLVHACVRVYMCERAYVCVCVCPSDLMCTITCLRIRGI